MNFLTVVMEGLNHEYKSNTHKKFYHLYPFKVHHNINQVDETRGTNRNKVVSKKLRSIQQAYVCLNFDPRFIS